MILKYLLTTMTSKGDFYYHMLFYFRFILILYSCFYTYTKWILYKSIQMKVKNDKSKHK